MLQLHGARVLPDYRRIVLGLDVRRRYLHGPEWMLLRQLCDGRLRAGLRESRQFVFQGVRLLFGAVRRQHVRLRAELLQDDRHQVQHGSQLLLQSLRRQRLLPVTRSRVG